MKKSYCCYTSGTQLQCLMDKLIIANVLESHTKRSLSSPEALMVAQLREELANRELSTEGKKPELVARLTVAVGTKTKVCTSDEKKKKNHLQICSVSLK